MSKSVRVLTVLAGLLAWQGPAAAADWTGIYGGASVGVRSLDTTWETTCLQAGSNFGECPDSSGVYDYLFVNDNPATLRNRDLHVRGYLGSQTQLSLIVLGIEGDAGYSDQTIRHGGIPGAEDPLNPLGTLFDSVSVTARWDASLRARAGFLITPSAMLYATGGISWLELQASAFCGTFWPTGWCSDDNVGRRDKISEVLQGWTFGGGFEVMLTQNILFRGEFRRSQYEDLRGTQFDGILDNVDAIDFELESATKTFSLGIGYKF